MPKFFLSLLFTLFFGQILVAQVAVIDSLEQQLIKTGNDVERIQIYIELTAAYSDSKPNEKGIQRSLEGLNLAKQLKDELSYAILLKSKAEIYNELHQYDYNQALEYFQEAFQILIRIEPNHPKQAVVRFQIASCINSIAYLYWQWGKLSESLTHYDSAIRFTSKLVLTDTANYKLNRLYALELNSQGAVLWGLGDYEEALRYYFKAFDVFEKLNNKRHMSLTSANIGLIYQSWGQINDALLAFRNAEKWALEANSNPALGYAYSNLGLAMEALQHYDSALNFFQLSTDTYQLNNNMGGVGLNLNRTGHLHIKLGRINKGIEVFYKALAIAEKNGAAYWIALAKQNLGIAYHNFGDYKKALRYANESIALAKKEGYREIVKDNYQNLTQVYLALNDYKRAFQSAELYNSIKDSLFNEEKFKQTSMLKAKFEVQKKEKENENLRIEAQLQERSLEKAKQLRYVLILIIFLILVFSLYVLISRRRIELVNKQLIKSNTQITQQKETLHQQASELQKANDIKNLMFSIISHDLRGPIHNLDSLVNMLNDEMLSTEEFKEILPFISTGVGNISNLTDNLLYWAKSQMEGIQIVPNHFCLSEMLRPKMSLFERMAHDKGISLVNYIPIEIQVWADPYTVELVIRNLVSNAIKFCHAGDTITLNAIAEKAHVKISISDTGQGIPPENIHTIFDRVHITTLGTKNEKGAGLGLMISKHFVELNGGKIWVESVYRKGSSFYFTLPVAH